VAVLQRSTLERLYWAIERRIVPGLRSSQEAYEEILTDFVHPGTRWLDLGCGSSLLPPWMSEAERRLTARAALLVGLDRDLAGLGANRTIVRRIGGDIGRLPFPGESFDLVTANMVVEHLDDPVSQFQEIRRVLSPGGVFVCHTPNARGYTVLAARWVPDRIKRLMVRGLEGRRGAEVFKTYYRANSPRALKRLAAAARLRMRDLRMTVSSAVLAIVPPLAFFELLWIRALRSPGLQSLRPTMIATFARD
jgi:ubiquinone/menaquinone biosynthesis C-methylase UbiE